MAKFKTKLEKKVEKQFPLDDTKVPSYIVKFNNGYGTNYTKPFQVEKFKEAQEYPYLIDNKTGMKVKRLKYGEEPEDWGANTHPCHDCGVTKGYYHWFGCDVERSPIKDEFGSQLLMSERAGNFSK